MSITFPEMDIPPMVSHHPLRGSTIQEMVATSSSPSTSPQISSYAEERERTQLESAIDASISLLTKSDMAMMKEDLREAHRLHEADLFKTQGNLHEGCKENASILVLIKYPAFSSVQSCRYSTFQTGKVRLTPDQLQSTGSEYLVGLLADEKHQRRAKKAAAPLDDGVTHVIDLSPTTDEDDFTIALQRLTITNGIKLWYRAMAYGVSPLAVSGHDDACCCLLPLHEQYPLPTPPEASNILGHDGEVCIFDTKEWPIEEHYNIDEFCQTRWAACLQRLFRSIAKPAGQKDLLIDSAPRMWTLVGLFSKLEMTNYDMLRDEVTAWFNADRNYLFVELCPEETMRISLALKIPLLTEPAFKILVNERALEVAGGRPRAQPTRTIFGRRCSDFSDTADTESISRIIEHAGTAMAERYKTAMDRIHGHDLLDTLNIAEWKFLCALDEVIPKASSSVLSFPIRDHYDTIMDEIRATVRESIDSIFSDEGAYLPYKSILKPFIGRSLSGKRSDYFHSDEIDTKRAYSVPKGELSGAASFGKVWASLNQHQRALCPVYWQSFRGVTKKDLHARFSKQDAVAEFFLSFAKARRSGELWSSASDREFPEDPHVFLTDLFQHIVDGLLAYVEPLVNRDETSFAHTVTPHLLLTLDDNELNFLRLAGDETRFEAEVPEADMGPVGPGPAFHTGHTVASVSDLDFENLAVSSVTEDDASTVVGSVVAQDGFSTIYNRNRILARSTEPSVASEQFTDGGMGAEFADAQYAVPVEHRTSGQALADIVEEPESQDNMASSGDDMDDLYMDDDSDVAVDGVAGDQLDDDDGFEMISTSEYP